MSTGRRRLRAGRQPRPVPVPPRRRSLVPEQLRIGTTNNPCLPPPAGLRGHRGRASGEPGVASGWLLPSDQARTAGVFAFPLREPGIVLPPQYVAYRQAPTPADEARPIGTAGPGEHEGLWSEQPMPGDWLGMADHAPTGQVVAGVGPGAEHRYFATLACFSRVPAPFSRVRGLRSILEAEDVIHDALNLRNTAPPMTP